MNDQTVMCDNTYPSLVLNCIREMQKDELLCDFKLIIGDEYIYAHKLILFAISPYFRLMYKSNLKETIQNEVTFHNIKFHILQQIIDFIYSGEILIDESNVFEIMEAGHMLQISFIKPAISSHLLKHLNTNNCLQIYAYVDRFDYMDLKEKLLEFINENFQFIVTKSNFHETPLEILISVICNDVFSISDICCTFEKWLMLNNKKEENFIFHEKILFKQFIKHLENLEQKFPSSQQISKFKDYIINRISKNEKISDDEQPFRGDIELELNQIIIVFGGSVDSYSDYSRDYSSILFPSSWRLSRIRKEDFAKACVECFNDTGIKSIKGEWSLEIPDTKGNKVGEVIPKMSTERYDFACVNKNNKVYIIGGCDGNDVLNTCEMYDVNTNEWVDIEPLPMAVRGCKAVVAENVLYVTGGTNEDDVVVNNVWMYNEYQRVWKTFSSMQNARSHHGACSINSSIYVLGGKTDNSAVLKSVERYDESLERWSFISPMPIPKWDFGYTLCGEYIYVFGGILKSDVKRTKYVTKCVQKYNTKSNVWEQCNPMLTQKSSTCCVVKKDKIFIIGGYDSIHGTLSAMDIYSPLTGKWHCSSSSMISPRKSAGAAVVYIPGPKKNEYYTGL